MNQKKVFLYAALIAIFFMLWQKWELEHPPASVTASAKTENMNLPPIATQNQAASEKPVLSSLTSSDVKTNPQSLVKVETDVFRASIDTRGGNLVQADLLKYPETQAKPTQPIALLTDTPDRLYVAQSGLISKRGPDNEAGQAVYTPEKVNYVLAPDQNSLNVKLYWDSKEGVRITKIFTFQRGKYDVAVRYQIENHSAENWSGQFYAQLKDKPVATTNSFFGLHTYSGGAISSSEKHYEKIGFTDFQKNNLDRTIQGGWLAMQQRYFLSAWISGSDSQNRYYTRFDPSSDIYTLGYVGPVIEVPIGKTGTAGAKIYAGPEITDTLAKIAPNLELTVDYGWLWFISIAIFAVMRYIYDVIGNWGWSIVLVTLLIKLLFYKLSEKSYRSMAKMRRLTPQLEAVRERFKDDRQKISQAMIELYRKEKVNPLSGCLPMLVQIPFFIALYYVLIESVELRQAPFIFWIHDLSVRDPYFILPILMGISMFAQQRLSPPPPDPIQAKMMMFLPVVFTVFFVAFPAGLVLYWLVNNCLSVLQQWYITRKIC